MGVPVFVSGGTGYIGRPLIAELIARGCAVHALTRPGSIGKLPPGSIPVIGDALHPESFATAIPPDSVIVHLIGTPHPSPAKASEFHDVDLASIRATTEAARQSRARHLVYVSVAHPAPVMAAYISARMKGEDVVRASGIPSTILRPWYVLGPGHRWPYVLTPLYAIFRLFPATRESALRLGLVTLRQMVAALANTVESSPPPALAILGVTEIRGS